MGKRKKCVADWCSSDNESNFKTDLLTLTQKKKIKTVNRKLPAVSGSDSDSDWEMKYHPEKYHNKKHTLKFSKTKTASFGEGPNVLCHKDTEEKTQSQVTMFVSEHEEGEVSDSDLDTNFDCNMYSSDKTNKKSSSSSSSSSESSSESEFDDGYDENLMGDEEDRKRLNGLSEKERETEIFKRIEQRDIMRTRWEIERKLKLARRSEKATRLRKTDGVGKIRKNKEEYKEARKCPQKEVTTSPAMSVQKFPSSLVVESVCKNTNLITKNSDTEKADEMDDAVQVVDYFDHKERSKERKKNVEMNRTDDKRSNAMALLKAKREGKAKREEEEAKRQAQQEREEEKEELESVTGGKSSVKLKASEIYSDDSGSSEWEDDKPAAKRSHSSSSKFSSESDDEEKEDKFSKCISSREDLNKLRLSRYKMERFINLPIFERIVMNCFVRISIGNNGQKPVYRVAEIVGVVETAKIYNLGKTRTNRGLRLKHGTQERVFRLEFISNQEFTESEFIKWREICLQQNVPMPSLLLLERKQKDIKEALNYEYKDEDVDRIIEEKNRFRNRPTNYAMRKTCLMKERDAAMLRGDYEIARNLGQQIEELESRASELDKRRSSSISLISYINDRNRKRNVEDAEKAIMEEVRANKGLKISDPFTRRITQPRMGFKSAERKGADLLISHNTSLPLLRQQAEVIDNVSKSNEFENSYNLYSLHDFDIDLDVTLPANPINNLPKPVPKMTESTTKRSLNLEDYKKKRGLI